MKIGIIGNYGNNNNGDEAILTGILTQLINHLHLQKEQIIVFSNHPHDTEKRYGVRAERLLHKKSNIWMSIVSTLVHHWSIVKELNVLIIGGGGLLMDMYKRDAPLYSTLGLLAHYAGCRVLIYGVGAGPIQTKQGAFFIRQLLQKANSISVRDEQSKQLLQQIGVKKEISVIGDPAFFVPSPSTQQKSSSVQRVAVTAVPYFSTQYWPQADVEKYNGYVKGMAQNLDELIAKKKVKVTFFSTKYPQDVQVTKHIAAQMKYGDHVQIIEQNLHPNDIVELCAQHDVVIGTRLHSLILAIVAHTPVVGIGYHQKVADFMKLIDCTEKYVPIASLNDRQCFIRAVEQMESDWETTLLHIEQKAQHLKNEAAKGLTQLKKAIQGDGA
jgi:polysaccharide pyruvyl transferase CsaB